MTRRAAQTIIVVRGVSSGKERLSVKILVINPGATSTKIAVFDGEKEEFRRNIEHTAAELAPFAHVIDQLDLRLKQIMDALSAAGYRPADFAAVCGRGGLLRHIPSGTYEVTDKVLADMQAAPYGEHASNLGSVLAKRVADMAGVKAYFVDPVSVDELTDVARVSGLKGMERESFFHALNQKSVARKAAGMLGRRYEDVNLIVVHMGGGVSVAAHEKGRVIDNYNVKDEGTFGMDRPGSLPVNAVINLCFSGMTKAEIKKLIGSEAGVYSYLGTRDFREVERRAFEECEPEARLIFDALAYQLAKDIGAMAAVLSFQVDAIALTGGLANSVRLCYAIIPRVSRLAKVLRLPGEEEMAALAAGAYRVLTGEAAKLY